MAIIKNHHHLHRHALSHSFKLIFHDFNASSLGARFFLPEMVRLERSRTFEGRKSADSELAISVNMTHQQTEDVNDEIKQRVSFYGYL